MLRLALYQPDIPQNTGTMLRLAACLGVAVEIIEPAGFDARTATCAAPASITSTTSRSPATAPTPPSRPGGGEAGIRLVLATTAGSVPYTAHPSGTATA